MTDLPEFRRIKVELLEPGDIVLTSSPDKLSKAIRGASLGTVSHAMLCVQAGSTIDSTDLGVQASNVQRELYGSKDRVFVLRLKDPISVTSMSRVIDFARDAVGTRYSKPEAIRSVVPGKKPRSRKMFCSRLVAKAFAYAGIQLVNDPDYCTPQALRNSRLLRELQDMTEEVSEAERLAWQRRRNPIAEMQEIQNAILETARGLDPAVENFGDLDRVVAEHPEWDATIADAYKQSGYLDLWQVNCAVNPWQYDLDVMNAQPPQALDDLKDYCISTIREFHTGGLRYATNLVHYRRMQAAFQRRTHSQLVNLYETLIRNDEKRGDVALAWLRQHFPADADNHLEWIAPHSEHWFSIVDNVEPSLGQVARFSIQHTGTAEVCSTCGDPSTDYRLRNRAEAMPGVPSLRLCTDCVDSRRRGGEVLEPV